MNAAEVLDAIGRKHAKCALVREVVVADPECNRYAAADAWFEGGRVGPMPAFEPQWRRIDGLMFDGGGTRTAIEVKVSRADFARESDAKRRAWRAITDRFVYAAPAGLLRPEEMPEGCGLWEVDERGAVTMTRRAVRNKDAKPIPHQVLVAFAYRVQRADKQCTALRDAS